MRARFKASLIRFNHTIVAMAKARKKVFPEELNRQMLKALVGGQGFEGLVQLTTKASEEEIRAFLSQEVTYQIKGKGTPLRAKMSRVLAAEGVFKRDGKVTKAALDEMEKLLINARVRSRAFMAASWLFSAFDLAKSVPGNTLTRQSSVPMTDQAKRRKANTADSDPAREGKNKVTVFNTAEGARKVAMKFIPKALNNVVKDMRLYLGKKYAQTVKSMV